MIAALDNLWIALRWNRRERGGRSYVVATVPPGAVCAEIGVWKGDFSARLLATGRIAALHLVDPWTFQPDYPVRFYGGGIAKSQADMDAIHAGVRDRFAAAPQIQVHRASSLDAARQFPDGMFDWLYIDGDHSYRPVLDDLTAWLPKLKSSGIICLDDYFWRDEAGRRSVKDAIDAFLARQPVARAQRVGGQFILRAAAGSPK